MGYRQCDRKPTSKKSSANPIPSPLQMRPFAPPLQPDETPELQPQPEDKKTASYNFADISVFDPDSPPPPPPSWTSSHSFQPKWEHPQLTPSTPVQPKLAIGQPNDQYEQEADRVASQVVQRINNPQPLQREEMPEEEELQMKPESGTIQREEMPEEELQMKSLLQRHSDEMTASPELETSIQSARGSGEPLADKIREPMEQAFGADFSGVTVHTDSTSDQLNQSIQAKAFTTGQDIFFRQGAYQPESRGGQELLAHELTHVVQQSSDSIHKTDSSDRSNTRSNTTLEIQNNSKNKIQRDIVDNFTDAMKQKNESSKAALKAYCNYLKRIYAYENIKFLLDKRLKKFLKDPNNNIKLARKVFHDDSYGLSDNQCLLNTEEKLVKTIVEAFTTKAQDNGEPNVGMLYSGFSNLYDYILKYNRDDIWKQFIISDEWKTYKAKYQGNS